MSYKETILRLVEALPFEVDPNLQVRGRPPTMASSQFLTNKEQGDWAEEVIFNAINERSEGFRAIRAGRADSVAAGDPSFPDFFAAYQAELNSIGKKPDLLVFEAACLPSNPEDRLNDDEFIRKATAAIEVRSSSFLANKYSSFIESRAKQAEEEITSLRDILLHPPYSPLLEEKAPGIYETLATATVETFRDITFTRRTWSSSPVLRELTRLLKALKEQIKLLQKRDHLSITPKLEDIALVNRWIQRYDVRHYYLQVFFDKAYIISFEDVLRTVSDPSKEGSIFHVEQDVKNQRKTTLKINIQLGKEVLGKIDMPDHQSDLRELDRGRLLFYVTFSGGKGYLDPEAFSREVIRHDE